MTSWLIIPRQISWIQFTNSKHPAASDAAGWARRFAGRLGRLRGNDCCHARAGDETLNQGATVTIVVVPRERFSHARRSLESVYQNTDYPFELIYVDGNSPAYVSQYLQKASIERHFRLVRSEEFLTPNQARNLGLREVRSKYVVFLDNDVEVEPGWLTHLITCAEETGAWAVGPLYFQGEPADRIIHMYGGTVELTETDGARFFDEEHTLNQRTYAEVGADLRRRETDFIEFHCALFSLNALRTLGPLDEHYKSNHEHIDISLLIRKAGGTVYVEPKSFVTYVDGLLDTFDLEFALLRWSDDWNRKSAQHFVEKWKIDAGCQWYDSVIRWGANHREHLARNRYSLVSVLKHHAARNLLTRRMYSTLRDFRHREAH